MLAFHQFENTDYFFARKNDGRFAADGSVLLNWQRPLDHAGRPQDTNNLRIRGAIEESERLRAAGDAPAALAALEGLTFPPDTYQRSLALFLAADCDRPDKILLIVDVPTNAEELVHFVMASVRERKLDQAKAAFSTALASELPTSMHAELENRISTFEALNP